MAAAQNYRPLTPLTTFTTLTTYFCDYVKLNVFSLSGRKVTPKCRILQLFER